MKMIEVIIDIQSSCNECHSRCNSCRYHDINNENICKIRKVNDKYPKNWNISDANEYDMIIVEIERAELDNIINNTK